MTLNLNYKQKTILKPYIFNRYPCHQWPPTACTCTLLNHHLYINYWPMTPYLLSIRQYDAPSLHYSNTNNPQSINIT